MGNFQKMSEAETEIMRLIWAAPDTVTSAGIIKELSEKKEWKPSTIWTFLGRLVEKGLVTAYKVGKTNYYTPALTEDEYRREETKQFLNSVHGGSVKSFFAALNAGKDLKSGELEELKQWLEQSGAVK